MPMLGGPRTSLFNADIPSSNEECNYETFNTLFADFISRLSHLTNRLRCRRLSDVPTQSVLANETST